MILLQIYIKLLLCNVASIDENNYSLIKYNLSSTISLVILWLLYGDQDGTQEFSIMQFYV